MRRMSRMQVYLPEELHWQVEQEGLPVSEILQEALRKSSLVGRNSLRSMSTSRS